MDVDQRQNGTSKAKFGPKKSSRGDLYVGSAALSYRRDHMEVSWGSTSLQKSTAPHNPARCWPACQCCTTPIRAHLGSTSSHLNLTMC